jgi:imidazolonepropionase-like amidohydrolase
MRTLPSAALTGLATLGALAEPATTQTSRTQLVPGTSAIVGATVIPMTAPGRRIADATIVIRDGRILALGPAHSTPVPAGATRIDGRGRFVIPGLADMHTHLFSDADAVPDSAGPAELGVMLANGVTAARLMIGTPAHLALRAGLARGSITGPQLWVASPQVAGREMENTLVVRSDAEARAAVRQASSAGYDFIKLTLEVPPPVFKAVIDEARRAGIRVVGHVEPSVGIERGLSSGMQLEHLDSFLEAVLADSAPTRTSLTQGGVFAMANWPSLDHVDDAKVERLAGLAARSGAVLGPTQHVFNTAFAIGEDTALITSRADFAHWPPRLRAGYLRAHARYWSPANDRLRTPARRARYAAVRDRIVKAFADSGGMLVAGSDTPEWFHTYGFGLHRELEALVRAGLTPWEALRSATVNPAAYLGAIADWGTLEVGKRADLVVLDADPLADIRHTARIHAMAIGGAWHDRSALDAMLARGRAATGGNE